MTKAFFWFALWTLITTYRHHPSNPRSPRTQVPLPLTCHELYQASPTVKSFNCTVNLTVLISPASRDTLWLTLPRESQGALGRGKVIGTGDIIWWPYVMYHRCILVCIIFTNYSCIFIEHVSYSTWSLLHFKMTVPKPFKRNLRHHGINWVLNRPWWRQPRQWASASSDRPYQWATRQPRSKSWGWSFCLFGCQ